MVCREYGAFVMHGQKCLTLLGFGTPEAASVKVSMIAVPSVMNGREGVGHVRESRACSRAYI